MEQKIDKTAVILAAGKGKRMKSDLPKVLHKLGEKYLVDHVIEAAAAAGIDRQIMVIGHGADLVRKSLKDRGVEFVLQEKQLGTGHAVMMARDKLAGFEGDLVVLCGDMPLVKPRTINMLVDERRRLDAVAVVLSVILDDPGRYGRVVRDDKGLLRAIIEYRDADDKIKEIREVNTGAYCFKWGKLAEILDLLDDKNDQNEYYLTDTISIFVERGEKVGAVVASDASEGFGINSVDELSMVESLINNGTK